MKKITNLDNLKRICSFAFFLLQMCDGFRALWPTLTTEENGFSFYYPQMLIFHVLLCFAFFFLSLLRFWFLFLPSFFPVAQSLPPALCRSL